jgi:hypothetical protein
MSAWLSLVKWGMRALQVIAVFFAAAIVIGQVEALTAVHYTAADWRNEFGKQALALVISLAIALIVGRLVIQLLRGRD